MNARYKACKIGFNAKSKPGGRRSKSPDFSNILRLATELRPVAPLFAGTFAAHEFACCYRSRCCLGFSLG